MSRKILYLAIALVPAQTAGLQNTGQTGAWQPHNPVVFAKPFSPKLQQFDALPWQGLIPTVPTPHGWEGQQLETRFAKPFPASEQQFSAPCPEHVPVQLDVEGVFAQPPDVFAKPFPVKLQQYYNGVPNIIISAAFNEGWRVYLFDYAFAKPFPVTSQQFQVLPPEHVPEQSDVEGWYGQQLEYKFATPFPARAQQYTAFQPRGAVLISTPQGWAGHQYEYRFAKPFPTHLQQYEVKVPIPVRTGIEFAIYPPLDYAFVKPFPVAQQIFSVWDLVGDVPPFHPPGAGKRYKKPTDYLPEPPYDVKPNKPFRPVWDKPKDGEVEQAKAAPAAPQPTPLPPQSIFGAPGQAMAKPALNLPDFNQFAPQDPLGLTKRMGDARDMSDAIALLKSMGLIREG